MSPAYSTPCRPKTRSMSLAQAPPLALCGCLFALGCQELAQEAPQQPSQDAVEDTTPAPQPAVPPQKGDLLIEELYYSGPRPKGGTDHYFSDQFIELVNTTDHPLDLSGVMIGGTDRVEGELLETHVRHGVLGSEGSLARIQ